MYLKHLYTLNAGDLVTYTDLHRKKRILKYIKDTGLVKAIVGKDYSLQQQFQDELGSIVHIPMNAWTVDNITPCIIRRKDYGL